MSIYSLPWYLLIGEPQSGKSTTLKNSGLEFPVGADALSGSGGTRNCDWWFSNEAVILDTAGRFTFQEESAPDQQEWSTFLKLLRQPAQVLPDQRRHRGHPGDQPGRGPRRRAGAQGQEHPPEAPPPAEGAGDPLPDLHPDHQGRPHPRLHRVLLEARPRRPAPALRLVEPRLARGGVGPQELLRRLRRHRRPRPQAARALPQGRGEHPAGRQALRLPRGAGGAQGAARQLLPDHLRHLAATRSRSSSAAST